MMPIPSHLRGLAVPLDSAIDEKPLVAAVQCACSERRFQFLYPGQTHLYNGQKVPCTAEINGRYFFLVAARCITCSTDNLLLDVDFHGWNGFICHDDEQAALPRPTLTAWPCEACGYLAHTGFITIQTEGRHDFIAEVGDEFDSERWPDGFGWFSMSLTCCRCNLTSVELVSCETM